MPTSSDSRDELISRSRRWFDEVWNQRREQTIEELMDPAAVVHGLDESGAGVKGPEGFRRFYRPMTAAIPDIRIHVEDVLCDSDQTVVRVRGAGTHTSGELGVPASGRAVTVTGIVWLRWRDGRIIEGWNEFDAAGMMRQITGPAPASVKAR